MTGTFRTVSKARNSTKQGTGGDSVSFILKERSSILKPRIAIKWSGATAPVYNHVYIAEYDRHYWIDNWTYDDRQWIADCSVDVLATFKTNIGNAEVLILRSASDYDSNVPDAIAVPIMPPTISKGTITSFNWAQTINDGYFVVSVTGTSSSSTTGLTYFQMNATTLQLLVRQIFGDAASEWSGGNFGSTIGDALKEFGRILNVAVTNPTSFINSIMWFPFQFPTSGSAFINLGAFTTNLTGGLVAGSKYTMSDSMSIVYSGEPWENMPPFANYQFGFLPFGVFDIDAAAFMEAQGEISFYVSVDPISGVGTLEVRTGYGTSERNLVTTSAQVGIPIQFGGNSISAASLLHAGSQLAQYMKSGSATALAGFLNSAADVVQPNVVTSGSSVGLAGIWETPWLQVMKFPHTPIDNDHQGKPLCVVDNIMNYSGYLKCADGDIELPGTQIELEQVKSFLTGGFFYE